MKKIIYLLAPLMVASSLTSCGNKVATYKVTAIGSTHLSFTTTEGKPLDNVSVTQNQDFKFKMKANNNTNDIVYVVPSTLAISVEGVGELIEGYDIVPNEDYTEADVTISGTKIIGNITITGDAVLYDYYKYDIKANYGLKPIPSGYKIKDGEDLVITFENNEKYKLPKAENIYVRFDKCPGSLPYKWVSPAEEDVTDYCTYGDGKLTIKSNYIRSNIIIVARANDYPLLDSLTWSQISEVSFSGAAKYIFYLGETKNVKVNNKNHQVRIIGFNEDYENLDDKVHTAIGITFEFVNLISDENGYSLATYWKNTNLTDLANHEYTNSSIRKALTGEGNGDLHWFEKDSKVFSTTYANKTVLNMLPEDLKEVLIAPSKYINIWHNSEWTEETVKDKLFLLSPREMGEKQAGQEEHTATYSYYEDSNANKIKYQVKGSDGARTEALSGKDLAGSYTISSKNSYAGYNSVTENQGSYYWFRSPYTPIHTSAWDLTPSGEFEYSSMGVYNNALPIAPAFCI